MLSPAKGKKKEEEKREKKVAGKLALTKGANAYKAVD